MPSVKIDRGCIAGRCLMALALALAATAARAETVAGVIAAVRAGIASHEADKQVAKSVSKVKLEERLDVRVVEELESEGAGPETVGELDRLREASAGRPEPRTPLPFSTPPMPSGAEQRDAVAGAREYAQQYVHKLPDFLCTQNVRRYEGKSDSGPWTATDILTVQVSFYAQEDDYKLLAINGKPTNMAYWSIGGALTEGEFGSLMGSVLDDDSGAEIHWDHWTHLRGHPAQVYSFRIAPERSAYHLEFGEAGEHAAATAGQAGLIYLDPETHAILRITRRATELPAKFPIRLTSTELDYDAAPIGDHRYFLPVRAVIRMTARDIHTRNLVEFIDYRKFSSDAVISFGDPIKK